MDAHVRAPASAKEINCSYDFNRQRLLWPLNGATGVTGAIDANGARAWRQAPTATVIKVSDRGATLPMMWREHRIVWLVSGACFIAVCVYRLRSAPVVPVVTVVSAPVAALPQQSVADQKQVSDAAPIVAAAPPAPPASPAPEPTPQTTSPSPSPAPVSDAADDAVTPLVRTLQSDPVVGHRLRAVDELTYLGRQGDNDGRIQASLEAATRDSDPTVAVSARDAISVLLN